MLNILKISSWKTRISFTLLLILLIILFLSYLVKNYYVNSIEKDWERISFERESKIKNDCVNLFNNYQNQVFEFSQQITHNKKLMSSFSSQSSKKTYESLFDFPKIDDYSIEIYNSRLELFLFSGRQLFPDILELQKAMNGEKFTSVKETGFYTFLLSFEPLLPVNDSSGNKSNKVEGVLVVAKLLDVNYKIKNSFFRNIGITRDIENKYALTSELELKPFSFAKNEEFIESNDFSKINLTGINSDTIAKLQLQKLDKNSYIDSIKDDFQKISSVLLFFLNIILFILIFLFSNKLDSRLLKSIILGICLVLSRYFWLVIDFPSNIFKKSITDVFSPAHYASSFAFGIGKSLGDLFITSLIVLLICSILISFVVKSFKKEIYFKNRYFQILFLIFVSSLFVTALQIYGVIIQSLVNDSNLKYFDRSQIIPTDQPELIIGQFIILLFSICLILLLVTCIIYFLKYFSKIFDKIKFFKREPLLNVIITVLAINLMMALFYFYFDYSISFWIRNLIIFQVSLFGFYIHRQIYLRKNFKINSALNYSIIALICIIYVPLVLLAKITSQENKYLELIARKVAEKEEDKITSLILSTMDDISEDRELQYDITNKNHFQKLAFNIWSKSTLYSEDLNTGVFVLDTAKRLISDFNINPEELSTDSVLSNSLKTFDSIFRKSKHKDINKEQESATESDEENDVTENDLIFQNRDLKYFYGIKPVEQTNLKNSKFNRIIGYVIVAAQYDSKNFIAQSGIQVLKNFSPDNLVNKLTSTPDISEFSNDELVSSTNKDISRSISKSLEPFRQSVEGKTDKIALRYDQFENRLYKSFYYLPNSENDNAPGEKIYVVSIKANDFGMMTFFFFKFLLLVVLIFIVFIFIYLLYKGINFLILEKGMENFKFGFREKIFASFIVVSVIPIIVLALYSREFVKEKNNEFYKSQIISDLKLVEQYIKHRSPPIDFGKLRQAKGNDYYNLQNIFGKGFSESHKNFNLYVFSKLVSTTDEQLYKSDLLDDRISGTAYYNIALMKKDYYSENTDIGFLNVIAGYKPIYDNYNNLLAIVSSQTVLRQNEINQELTENLVYIFGVYFVAVIFLIIIVNILSYTISNPIIRLQRATELLSKGNIEIEVKSTSKDEIGDLIASFNKMTKELKRSREELKKAERESAWRDIARQVAHEIKNPLTPMKLAMQHLYFAYSRGSNDFKTILQTTNRLIIDQIETLNKIATEFSDFAKMPSRNYEPLDINSIVQDVVRLLNTDNKISIDLGQNLDSERDKTKKHAIVVGDIDEIKRALINIIRNSLQAIDEKVSNRTDGKIQIYSKKFKDNYSLIIKDNGIGMDEPTLQQLFEPYFSTKSSGMGLGLVITKKIIDDMNGRIFVKSQLNFGTTVEIVFKLQ
jgi:signal transduction histidine kinase